MIPGTVQVDAAKSNDELLIFLTHATDIELDATGIENLRQIIRYVKQQGVQITTVSKAIEQVGNLFDSEDTLIAGSGKLYGSATELQWGRAYWGGSSITAATPPQAFTGGTVTYSTVSNAGNTDWPTNGYGNIITQRLKTSAEAYTFQQFVSSSSAVYTRRGATPTSWGSWVAPPSAPSHFIVDAASPTYTDDAASTYPRGTTLQRVNNPGATSPSGGPGMLITHRLATDYAVQEFHSYNGGNMYRRTVNSAGAWLPWTGMAPQ